MAQMGPPESGYPGAPGAPRTQGAPSAQGAPTVVDAYYSLLAEGAKFQKLPEEKYRFQKLDLDEALEILANDPSDIISPAARYHALAQLAHPVEGEGLMPREGGLPGFEGFGPDRPNRYRAYAETFAAPGRQGELVDHVHVTEGQELPAEELLSAEAALVVLDTSRICTADLVTAHTRAGTAERTLRLYSEFNSSKPFNLLAGWLDPSTWPDRGPLLFKSVKVVQPPGQVAVPAGAGQGWRGTYLEEVELLGRRLLTYLDCSFQSLGGYAALTYDLNKSEGNELTVDRGYLSVTRNPDGTNRVRALKLVAFTDGEEAIYEDLMCPVWTDCVQQAAEHDRSSAGKIPPQSVSGPGVLDPQELSRRWNECMSDATAAYSNLAVDVAQEMMGGTYDMDDYRRHGLWLWTNLARDWSRAWMGTLEVVDQMSRLERGDPSGRAVPLAPPKTVVIVGPVGADTDVAVTDLSGIGGNRHTIPSATLTVSPKVLAPGSTVTISGADGTEVTVTAGITDAPPGLYVGGLHAGASTEPVLLYVSDAVGPAGEAVG